LIFNRTFDKKVGHFSFDVEPSDPKEKIHVGHSGPGKMNAGHSFAMPANQPQISCRCRPASRSASRAVSFSAYSKIGKRRNMGKIFPGAGANRGARVPPYKPALHPVPTCDKFFLMTVWK